MAKKILTLWLLALGLAGPAWAAADWAAVDAALGRPGAEQPGNVRRYSFPRSDLRVTLDGVRLKPAFALGSWLAFREMGDHAEVMGDLVLTHDEVNPVLSRLLEGGLTITALHNHLLRSAPATMYMHVHGHGDPIAMARTIRSALGASRTPTGRPAPAPEQKLALDTAALDRLIGATGRASGGVYQFSIPRAEPVRQNGEAVPASLGLGTVINFQPTGRGRAAITGDFVLTEPEVTPVLRTLRSAGIEVTALHNHMTGEEPRLFFMHFWANDDIAPLGRGLRRALDGMNVAQGQQSPGGSSGASAEMAAIFAADQAAREDPGAINWKVVAAEDERHRLRTKELLDGGALTSGDDFYHAAFIFQHGTGPSDFLIAHTLAVAAAARGRADATWIAAATLDRYLQSIQQPQIYGTQYHTPDRLNTTQEPYNRELISDSLRQTLDVPTQAKQEVRRSEIQARYRSSASH